MSRLPRYIIAQLGVLSLVACSGGPGRVKPAPAPPATRTASTVDGAFALLMQGDEHAASGQLKAILKREPMNATATMLLASIKGDPREQLGQRSFSYKARPGDTIEGLAQRFLGNRLKAYQLLRYNGLRAPAALSAGQEIRIPGEAPRPEPPRRSEPETTRPTPAAPPKAKNAAPQSASPVTTGANPGLGRQLRTQGLAALNQGNIDRATNLLLRAKQLDPGNALIARDLARAQRIAATVRARK